MHHGRLPLIESGQEVVCEMPYGEIRHEGRQVLREPIREGWLGPSALSQPFGQFEGGSERFQEKESGIFIRNNAVCLRTCFPQEICKISVLCQKNVRPCQESREDENLKPYGRITTPAGRFESHNARNVRNAM
jgi:hypothetical protein